MLGLSPSDDAVLLSDGYSVYASYAKQVGLTHAQCSDLYQRDERQSGQ